MLFQCVHSRVWTFRIAVPAQAAVAFTWPNVSGDGNCCLTFSASEIHENPGEDSDGIDVLPSPAGSGGASPALVAVQGWSEPVLCQPLRFTAELLFPPSPFSELLPSVSWLSRSFSTDFWAEFQPSGWSCRIGFIFFSSAVSLPRVGSDGDKGAGHLRSLGGSH